jgi:hypothetical protein
MGGKYKIHPADMLVLAGLYAAGLVNYLLFQRLSEVFGHCGYLWNRDAPEAVTGSQITINL